MLLCKESYLALEGPPSYVLDTPTKWSPRMARSAPHQTDHPHLRASPKTTSFPHGTSHRSSDLHLPFPEQPRLPLSAEHHHPSSMRATRTVMAMALREQPPHSRAPTAQPHQQPAVSHHLRHCAKALRLGL